MISIGNQFFSLASNLTTVQYLWTTSSAISAQILQCNNHAAILVLVIPNSTATHGIAYTKHVSVTMYIPSSNLLLGYVLFLSSPFLSLWCKHCHHCQDMCLGLNVFKPLWLLSLETNGNNIEILWPQGKCDLLQGFNGCRSNLLSLATPLRHRLLCSCFQSNAVSYFPHHAT